MSRQLTTVAILLACVLIRGGGTVAVAQAPVLSGPLAANEHPRLFINSQTWSSITAVVGSGGALQAKFQGWVTWLDGQYASTPTKDRDSHALNFAFVALMAGAHPAHPTPLPGIRFGHTAAEYMSKAITLFDQYLSANKTLPPSEAAVLYDWTWHSLTAEQREAYAATLATGLLDDSNTNAWGDSGDVRAMAARVLRGLAVYGDGYGDDWALQAIAKFEPWFRSTTKGVTMLNALYGGQHGGFAQGAFYGIAYTAAPIEMVEEGYRTALGLSLEAHYAGPVGNLFRYMPKMAYDSIVGAFPRSRNTSSYPADGYQWWFYNNEMTAWTPPVHTAPPSALWRDMQFTAGVFSTIDPQMAGFARWMLQHRVGDTDTPAYTRAWLWGRVLYGRAGVSVAPLSPQAIGYPTSVGRDQGMWVFRTSHDTTIDEPVVMLLAGRWVPGDYGFRHSGAFHVYRKGPQIARGGSTDGHHNKFGIFGSIMTFVDRKTPPVPENGLYFAEYTQLGAERTGGGAQIDYLKIAGTHREGARVQRQWLADGGRDVDYVSLDLTRLYSSTLYADTGGARLSSYTRQFVYFRPANPTTDSVRLVIFDRPRVIDPYSYATGQGRLGKTWLLWTAGEPQFATGTASPGPLRGPTGTGGKTFSDNTTLVTATNTRNGADGKVWLSPILPSNRRVVKVGGPSSQGVGYNMEGTDPSLFSHEFETPTGYALRAGNYGINSTVGNAYPDYTGAWHIEVEDLGGAESQPFLNVVEVSDATAAQSPTTALAASGFAGVRIGNRIALFGLLSDEVALGSFVAPVTGTFKVLWVGLKPNAEYEVTGAGSPMLQTTGPSGALYLEQALVAGATIQVRATGVVVPPPTAPSNPRIVG